MKRKEGIEFRERSIDRSFFISSLLQWFSENKEPHFFRSNRTPYTTWVSEVALQQTRLEAAIPKLRYFLEKFPGIKELAEANEEAVLSAFQGLGYYNRARNLRKGAIEIQKRGSFPRTYKELLEIPSIGDYTASAISSLCFGEKKPVVDGNVKRVMARFFAWEEDTANSVFLSGIRAILQEMMDDSEVNPGELNEALMELGQKICSVGTPDCIRCPLSFACAAYSAGTQNEIPQKKEAKPKTEVTWYAFFDVDENENLLLIKFDDAMPFLKGHWGFPSVIQKNARVFSNIKLPHCQNVSQYVVQKKAVRHTITTHKISLFCAHADFSLGEAETRRVPLNEAPRMLASSAMKKVWEVFVTNLNASLQKK